MDQVIFEAASGASEVGANAYLIEAGGRRILLDAGARQPGKAQASGAPEWVHEIAPPDACWISHAHWDHLGALGALKARFPRLACFCSAQTRELAKIVLKTDADRSRRRGTQEAALATLLNAVGSREYFDPLRYSPPMTPMDNDIDAPVKFRAMSFGAGHIAGAKMLLLEVERGAARPFRILYTGDFCGHDQVLQSGALFPRSGADFEIDMMLMEGILATQKDADALDYAAQMRGLCARLRAAPGRPALVGAARLGCAAEVVAGLLDAGVAHRVHEGLEAVVEVAFRAAGRGEELGRVEFVDEPGCARALRAGEAVVAPGEDFGRGTPAGRLLLEVCEDPEASVILLNRAHSKTVAATLLKAANAAQSAEEASHKKKPIQKLNRLGKQEIRAKIAHFILPNHAPRHQLIAAALAVNPRRLVLVHGHRSQLFSLKRAIEKAGYTGLIDVPQNGERLQL